MLSNKEEYEELKSLLYHSSLTHYGKRKLIDMFEKQSKEIEELKEKFKYSNKYMLSLSYEDIKELFAIIKELKEDNEKKSIVIIKYQNFYEKLHYKIKENIEELHDNIQYCTNPLSINNSKFGIKILQSLLEFVKGCK